MYDHWRDRYCRRQGGRAPQTLPLRPLRGRREATLALGVYRRRRDEAVALLASFDGVVGDRLCLAVDVHEKVVANGFQSGVPKAEVVASDPSRFVWPSNGVCREGSLDRPRRLQVRFMVLSVDAVQRSRWADTCRLPSKWSWLAVVPRCAHMPS